MTKTDDVDAQQKQRPAQKQSQQPGKEHDMVPEPIIIRDSYHGSGRLKDKVALVTGGDSGIGRAVAVHFAKEGADVAIVYLNEHKDAEKTKKMVEKEKQQCLMLSGDVKDVDFCRTAVKEVFNNYNRLNILVNIAGEQHPTGEFADISPEQLEQTFRTNFFSFFYMSQVAAEKMQEGDVILNTSSVTAYRGSGHLIDYASTKGAIAAFTRSLSSAMIEKGIRVNGIAPGPIWTPLIPATFPKDRVKDFGKNTPMGRAGQPAEVAPAYVFLASEEASYITGQMLHPNGGQFVST